ncbi:TIGR02611 family protein [Tsukamurella sp. NPDC003166]|uniref:TIGR02611 family protein n=1 Tax=Tsukamurella sp. NPDC003166 TaxID=3154444 RepID=UPI0033B1FEB9
MHDEQADAPAAGLRAWRRRIRSTRFGALTWRIGVGVVGAVVLVCGVIAIPYPGPGWLIVFAGLGILATEFDWAQRLLRFARARYDRFAAWLSRQRGIVKVLFGLGTCAIVLATLWLLGALRLVAGWFGVHWAWLAGPLLG